MEANKNIFQALQKAEKKARQNRFSRFIGNPIRYPLLLAFQYGIYKIFKKGLYIKSKTFFGTPIKLVLPSGTDIVLNKIKSHDSEIRLSKFLTLQLSPGDTFIDIGAHYGFYSLLASKLVGADGKVFSVEPSVDSYKLLKENTASLKNIKTYNAAASSKAEELVFYEYPGPYSEYNTMVANAYVNENWAKKIKPVVSKISTVILDELIAQNKIDHAIVKIDVEGGEPEVLGGMKNALGNADLIIVIEFLIPKTLNSPHVIAAKLLQQSGYNS